MSVRRPLNTYFKTLHHRIRIRSIPQFKEMAGSGSRKKLQYPDPGINGRIRIRKKTADTNPTLKIDPSDFLPYNSAQLDEKLSLNLICYSYKIKLFKKTSEPNPHF